MRKAVSVQDEISMSSMMGHGGRIAMTNRFVIEKGDTEYIGKEIEDAPKEGKESGAIDRVLEPNIFRHYVQVENQFTNGFISILGLSWLAHSQLPGSFLDMLGIKSASGARTIRVLRGIDGTADAELSGDDFCILFETKIKRGSLDGEQIRRHLERLECRSEAQRRLVLLTPDDTSSSYIKRSREDGMRPFPLLGNDCIRHIGWKDVYELVANSIERETTDLLSELFRQFLSWIYERIIEKDIYGIVQKVSFSPATGLNADTYLDELRSEAGVGRQWNTPREYKSLDGKGRKLLLYDRNRHGITAEVEIQGVQRTDQESGFPWTNTSRRKA